MSNNSVEKQKKNQNGHGSFLMGPGGAVGGKNQIKKSRETVPLS